MFTAMARIYIRKELWLAGSLQRAYLLKRVYNVGEVFAIFVKRNPNISLALYDGITVGEQFNSR